jgi:uncharacterized membrane protein YhaH (DUF805 family)
MERRAMLWTLTAFFGATVAFNLVANLTEDESTVTRLVLQLAVLAVIVTLIVVVVRRTDRSDDG